MIGSSVCQGVALVPDAGMATGLAVDPGSSGSIFWTDYKGNQVWSMPKGGPTPRVLHKAPPDPAFGDVWPNEIAVDASRVYWTSNIRGSRGTVSTTDRDGGGFQSTGALPTPQMPWGIALDSTFVYVVTRTPGAVWKAPIGGVAFTPLYAPSIDAGLSNDGTNILVDPAAPPSQSGVFWADALGVQSIGKDGAHPALLSSDTDGWAIAVNDTDIFWVTRDGQYLVKARRDAACDGGVCETQLALIDSQPQRLAVDDRFVYWGTADASAGTIWAVPLGGGQAIRLTQTPGFPYGIAVDDVAVYWTNQRGLGAASYGSLYKVAKPPR